MCLCQLGYIGESIRHTTGDCIAAFTKSWNAPCRPRMARIVRAMDLPTISASTAYNPGGDVFDRLLKERIVFLGGQVTDELAIQISAKLLLLEAEDHERDIYLYINSPGGSVYAGMAIYDTMQFVRPDVSTICLGMAASMGQFLLCAGEKGKRYSLPHGRILMHQPLGQMQGQASDIAIHAENMMRTKKEMAELIAFHTGQSVEQVAADSDRDRWFTAQQALDYGMIDAIVERNPVP
jgi:ATP-dependent Clp protease, protease subunit